MTDREKLIDILMSKPYGHSTYEEMADYLIANGVTVQQWIPVSERLPTEEDSDDNGFVYAYTAEKRKIIALWTDVCRFSEFVTHWMPLPEPPKGE